MTTYCTIPEPRAALKPGFRLRNSIEAYHKRSSVLGDAIPPKTFPFSAWLGRRNRWPPAKDAGGDRDRLVWHKSPSAPDLAFHVNTRPYGSSSMASSRCSPINILPGHACQLWSMMTRQTGHPWLHWLHPHRGSSPDKPLAAPRAEA